MNLCDVIVQKLKNLKIPLENMRGQGYDNGANMKGIRSGVQSRIRSLNPRAFFVPCSSHSLNLVVNDMAMTSLEAANFFCIIQKIYVFFSASTSRWGVLLNHIEGLTLKPLSTTRWESRVDAVKPFRYQIGNIFDALVEIYEDSSADPMVRTEASALAKHIKDFKFVCSIIVWYDILNHINPVSKLMQKIELDLLSVCEVLKKTITYMKNQRSDVSFENLLVDAKELALELEIDANFEIPIQSRSIRKRRVPRQFEYEGCDEPIDDPKQKFKIDFFYRTIDVALNSMEERFQQIMEHRSYFNFLYDIYNIKNMPREELIAHCKDLQLYLTDGDGNSDIHGMELVDELLVLCTLIEPKQSAISVLNFALKINIAPNVVVALRILLTLPITVASGERSFSKLKLIKTYLRSTMSQDRLEGLATISIEHNIGSKLDVSNLIKTFAEQKARRHSFY